MESLSNLALKISKVAAGGSMGSLHSGECKDPSLWKENKASSGAEDDAKSAEVGTHEVGHWSNLSGGRSSA